MTGPRAYVRTPAALWRTLPGEVLVLGVPTPAAGAPGNELVRLSGSAPVLWQLLERPHRIDELVAEVARVFRVPVAEVDPAVRDAVARLRTAGAVAEVDP
ncbi:MAG: PqqD family protein [Actinomycetes bacterium]